ncbi:MAG: A24 family peptidase [Alphaproteobacteria bacterium]|nr:A24 family peptidase [Alphaproteobacteria bacterium]
MLEIISIFSLAAGLAVLAVLSVIDLRVRLLPNEWVLAFACLGLIFHVSTVFSFLSLEQSALGAIIGGGILYLIRGIANMATGEDSLGLGDVKLMAAAGVWLGPHHILFALTLGAIAGILHGLGMAAHDWRLTGRFPNLGTLSLPGGPGFAVGIVLSAVLAFRTFPAMIFS